nr:immunoglobulin light chain junction region [Macaca mulatta]MOW02288.1 immunoglobulin light chain junction region [Macaca mulatta]MOW02314.1 immunoglobulin light chain junction region [Macaca mulatta]MOW15265.1 immunoglobulin light chain junction region [Macaca mulatta]MOW17182.1 immunoglobulin light chain junction region [Macaca mulatta]
DYYCCSYTTSGTFVF